MKRGYALSIFGLLLGLGLGLGVLVLQRTLLTELLGLLQDELSKACDCTLAYDSAHLSLFRLQASATNLRIEESGESKLQFESVEADFSLGAISRRRLLLTELRISEGTINGVWPQSATYRFVEELASPPPPERNTPDRWKVELQKLTLSRARLFDRVGSSVLRGESASLVMTRTSEEGFTLLPVIGDLRLDPGAGATPISLGSLKGQIDTSDHTVFLRRVTLAQSSAKAEVSADVSQQSEGPTSGTLHFSFDDEAFGIAHLLSLFLYGSAEITGTTNSPSIAGNFSNPTEQPFTWRAGLETPLDFPSVEGSFGLSFSGGSPKFTISRLQARGPEGDLTLREALNVDEQGVSGRATISIERLDIDDLSLEGLSAELWIDSPWSLPRPQATIKAQRLVVADNSLGALDGSLALDGDALSFNARTSPGPEDLPLSVTARGGVLTSPKTDGGLEILPTRIQVDSSPNQNEWIFSLGADVQGSTVPFNLTGSGEFSLNARGQSLNGSLELSEGVLSAQARSSSNDVTFEGTFPFAETLGGSIILALKDFDISAPSPLPSRASDDSLSADTPTAQEQCGKVSALLRYTFQGLQVLDGDGSLDLSSLSIGCKPYRLELPGTFEFPIANRTLTIRQFALRGQGSQLSIDGQVGTELNLHIVGSLALPSLAPLLGTIDDLRGQIELSTSVSGPIAAPNIEGQIRVTGGGLDLAASDLSLRDISGTFSIIDRGLDFSDVRGEVNEGAFELSGRIDPLAIESSVATLRFRDIFLNPSRELSANLSGSLGIGPDQAGSSVISGIVTVDSAEFRRDLNLAQMVRDSALALLAPRDVTNYIPSRSDLPNIPLDIRVSAPRNMLIDTPWAAGELSADFRVRGTISNPEPDGSVEVLSGWVGLQDRRFEITNGRVILRAPSLDPELDILAEATMRSRQGDVMLVFLQISGLASAPRLSLSSDRGISEREILSLLTSRSEVALPDSASSVAGGLELDTLRFLEDKSFLGLGRLVRDLALIDSIALEPTFSPQRGTVEPTLVATKRTFDHLSLVAQTPLGSSRAGSSLRLVLEATPALEISGIFEAQTEERQGSLGIDAAYTLLGERKRFLDIRMSGNRLFRTLDILTSVRLNTDSRVRENEIPAITDRIQAFYASQGLFDSTVEGRCEEVPGFVDDYCHQLVLKVFEGRPSYIERVRFEVGSLPEQVPIEPLERFAVKSIAAESLRLSFEKRLVNALRSEGFLAARVSTRFDLLEPVQDETAKSKQALGRELVVKLSAGDPVTFQFINHKVFSPEEFLETINLFGRKQPFGNNTIVILQENIKRMYNEAGYLFASSSVERSKDTATGRITFAVSIDEGPKLGVSEVIFEGLETLTRDDLERSVREEGGSVAALILEPAVAVPEQLEVNAETLTRVLQNSGFPEARVEVQAIPRLDDAYVEIHYRIHEGPFIKASSIIVSGYPTTLPPLPPVPAEPLPIAQVNNFIQTLTRTLSDHGFRSASVSTSLDENGVAHLSVDPGQLSLIRSVTINGYSSTDPEVIRGQLLISEGSAWDETLIAESRRRLLRLGLFNRVNIGVEQVSDDGSSGILAVQVQERSLRTVTVGAGANSELGLHLFGEAADRKIFGDGRSLTLRIDTYHENVDSVVSQGIASLTYGDPLIAGADFQYFSDLRFQRLELENQEFNLDRVGFANYLHRSRIVELEESDLTWSFGHTIFLEDLTDVSPGAIIGEFDTGEVRLGFLSSVVTFDHRDDPLNPVDGYTFQLENQLASKIFGSEASFLSLLGRASYLSELSFLSPKWSFAAASRVGSAWTYDDTDQVPISQRYYLGGRTSVRGFGENSLGPRGFDEAIQGGDITFVQNIELRYLLRSSTQLLGFVDVGGLFLRDRSMLWDDVREAAGLGVRFISPIGPLGLDVGFPLDRRDGEREFRVHFNIGSNF